MQFNQIKELIKFCADKKIFEVELEDSETKIRIQTEAPQPKVRYMAGGVEAKAGDGEIPDQVINISPQVNPSAPAVQEKPKDASPEDDPNLVTINSPMVGTMYHAPSPEADPFVKVGDVVNPDSVLCIVEAMKLMNEIKAENKGKIVKILVENGQPVEYGQPIFLLDPR